LGGEGGCSADGVGVCILAAARATVKDMADLKLQVPVTEEVKVDADTLAKIDHGIEDADGGRIVPLDEVRKMIPQWISKFKSQKPR
jgi:predicted transcriptional regulator